MHTWDEFLGEIELWVLENKAALAFLMENDSKEFTVQVKVILINN